MVTVKSQNLLLRHIQYFAGLLIIWFVYLSIGIGCPIYALFDIHCPTCGATRALLGLLSGNWELYFQMNPFSAPIAIAVVICIHLSSLPGKWRNYGLLYIILTAISNFVWYICTFVQHQCYVKAHTKPVWALLMPQRPAYSEYKCRTPLWGHSQEHGSPRRSAARPE